MVRADLNPCLLRKLIPLTRKEIAIWSKSHISSWQVRHFSSRSGIQRLCNSVPLTMMMRFGEVMVLETWFFFFFFTPLPPSPIISYMLCISLLLLFLNRASSWFPNLFWLNFKILLASIVLANSDIQNLKKLIQHFSFLGEINIDWKVNKVMYRSPPLLGHINSVSISWMPAVCRHQARGVMVSQSCVVSNHTELMEFTA